MIISILMHKIITYHWLTYIIKSTQLKCIKFRLFAPIHVIALSILKTDLTNNYIKNKHKSIKYSLIIHIQYSENTSEEVGVE